MRVEPQDRISAPVRRDTRQLASSLSALLCEGPTCGHLQTRKRALTRLSIFWHLILDTQPLKLGEINVCHSSHPVYGILS